MTDNQMPSVVPCGACTACCHKQAVFLKPESGDEPKAYLTQPWTHPKTGQIALMLDHKPNGDCIYLGETGCTIYERRPHMCRLYDCRKVYLTIPHKEREALIAHGQMQRKVENAACKRISTLTDAEVLHCRAKRRIILQGGGGHVVVGDGRPTG